VIVVGAIISYNRFVAQRNTVEESWRQVDVELQRRHDLIGNLVEVVKASARFEQNTLTQIVQARSQAMSMRGAGPQAQGQFRVPSATATKFDSAPLSGVLGLALSLRAAPRIDIACERACTICRERVLLEPGAGLDDLDQVADQSCLRCSSTSTWRHDSSTVCAAPRIGCS